MSKRMVKVELDLGEVEVCNVMIDIDGTNLEEGIDMYYKGEHITAMVGISADSQSEGELEEMSDALYNYKFK
jgi:hypothetical protein